MEKMMCKQVMKLSAIRLIISLLSVSCIVVLSAGVSTGEMAQESGKKYDTAPVERFIDFIDGEVGSIGGGVISLYETEYYLSQDTRFTNMTEDTLDEHDIQSGDTVRITFAPMENNIVLVVELQEKAMQQEKNSFKSNQETNRKTNKVNFENGVYSN